MPLLAREALDLRPHQRPRLGIEAGRRLVEEQHLRAVDQAQRDVEATLHAAGVRLDLALGGVGEPEALELLVGAPAQLHARDAVELALEHEVLAARGLHVAAVLLADDADRAPDLQRRAEHVVPGHPGASGVRSREGREDPDGGGFAGAVRPEQAEDGAGLDGEIEAVEGLDLPVALREAVGLDRVLEHCLSHLEQCSTPVQCSCQMTAVPDPPWWRRRGEPGRDRRPLTRDAIVEAALVLLERDGLQGLSMRKLAQELDAGAASLYWHVGDKEELLSLLLDRIVGEADGPGARPGELAGHGQGARAQRPAGIWRERRDAAQLSLGRVPAGPNSLPILERNLAVLAASALPPRVIAYAADMFALYVGAFAYEESVRSEEQASPEQLGAYWASLPPEQFPRHDAPRRGPDRGRQRRALRVRDRPARPRTRSDGVSSAWRS